MYFDRSLLLLALVLETLAFGEKAFEACRSYGETMLECHNILFPGEKMRVPIDNLLYPHMVLIGFRQDYYEIPAWNCGGSLISEKWVLTAAHCCEDTISGPPSILRVGTATFEFDEVEDLDQERNISKIIVHPRYKVPSKYNDIALIKADKPFTLSRDIRIACLPLKAQIPSKQLTAIGFGKTVSEAIHGSQTLMKVDVDIIDSKVCNRSMRFLIKKGVLRQGILDSQFCAGDYENGGRDTCQGDSGGPLQMMEEHVDCIKTFPLHIIIGVTSFGRDCGRRMAPGVYTNVFPYLEWIESIVWS